MTAHQLVKVALRLTAIWVGWLLIRTLILTAMIQHRLNEALLVSLVSALAYLLLGVLLWWGADGLARRLLGRHETGSTPTAPACIQPQALLSVLTIFVGLLVIFNGALEDGGHYLTMVGMMVTSGHTERLLDPSTNLPGQLALGKLLIGLAMIGTARRTAGWLLTRD